ncbi:hypothetical protein GCM10022415_15860 [Knoellia locipacati]
MPAHYAVCAFGAPYPRDVIEDVGFQVNWISVPIFFALAGGLALHAKRVSGGWTRPWIGIKPLWWFVLIFFVPFVGVPVLVVRLIANRDTPGVITGRGVSR